MRILFVNPHPFPPQLYGGVETSTLDMAERLSADGHTAAIMAQLAAGGTLWLVNRLRNRLSGQAFPSDQSSGMLAFRGWDIVAGLRQVAVRFRPNAVVVQGGSQDIFAIAQESVALGLSTFLYVHNVAPLRASAAATRLEHVTWFANSAFTASVIRDLTGHVAPVFPPVIAPARYRTDTLRRCVTLVNPRPEKGGPLAAELAALCPEIPFLFIEAWDASAEVQALRLETAKLSNVQWRKSGRGMREFYRLSKLILAPSRCEETWGRVISEAQLSGIPALASDRGALEDTVGPAGIVLPAESPAAVWADALRQLWNDERRYAACSAAALEYSGRPEVDPTTITRSFVQALSKARSATTGAVGAHAVSTASRPA